MKISNLVVAGLVAASLSLGAAAQATEEKEGEQGLKAADVPAAVQKTAEAEAKGGKIIRWEKTGANYEAVIEKKNGKQVGIELNADGKVVGKHSETKEQKEKKD